ncbi:hypothetical protein BGZ65_004949 [Modicella reniformis]|uniref:Uncharacterized protein n=1 Tax=Modicella reniformis TaxID=1440133 RepID=A0A9P6MLL0_9FUNG|nr:hypothetical protein BGZ65_004949 [Modicella reniformis]
MRFSAVACTIAAFAAAIHAVPIKWSFEDTVSVLNYALTLEHLEAKFYKQGLAKFDTTYFTAAESDDKVRERFVHIGEHENDHV